MHRAIGYLSKRFVQVRPGEGRRVVLTFLYFFLIITAYYLIKPVSRSLVLGELGSRLVPYVDLVCAVLMGPVVTVFARLVDRVPKSALVSGSFGVVIALLLGFWKLLALPVPWVAGAFYIWVAIFSVLVVTLFWLVANDLYRPREAKRLFGFIGSGGILGGIVGSSLAAAWAKVLGTENLILLSAALLCLCWVLVQELWTLTPDRAAEEGESAPAARRVHVPGRRETFLTDLGGFAKLLLESRYLLLLVAVVGLSKLVGTLVYYQFNPFIERAFPDQDARTAFTAAFFGGMNVIAFIIQFFFTSWILRRWGIFTALLALPAGLLLGTTGLLAVPAFWLAAGTELYDGSLNYSLHQTTKEVLYLPIDRSIRYKVKPFIDMVVFRFGKGIAALIGIILLDALHMPPQALSCVAIPLVAVWLLAAVQLRRDYVVRIRTILQARAASRHAPPPRAPAEPAEPGGRLAGVSLFRSLVDAPSSARKLALLNRLIGAEDRWSTDAAALLAELTAYETRPPQAADRRRETEQLKRTISDPHEPMAARCEALRRLAGCAEQATVDYLFGIATVEADAVLRQEALCGLVRLRLGGGGLEFMVQPVRRQIVREVANYERIAQVAQVYRRHHGGAPPPDDPLLGLFRVLMEETVEQVFRLLVLLHRPDDIQLVYEQLSAPDAYLRADAIELLDNLVDPSMRRAIAPLLDEDRFLSRLDEPPPAAADPVQTHRLLQDAIWDHNCWLSVTTLCVVGRLRLPAMRQELEKATQHAAAFVSSAAKLALHFSEQA